jgi:hypothetical protein
MESNVFENRKNEKNEKNKIKLYLEACVRRKVENANIVLFNTDRKDLNRVILL